MVSAGKTVPGEDQESFRYILGAGRSALEQLRDTVLLSPGRASGTDVVGEGKERDLIQRWQMSSEHIKC